MNGFKCAYHRGIIGTYVRLDRKATGIDQKKQSIMLAARLRSLPVLRALLGRPTLSQNISLGSGAPSTVILVAVTREKGQTMFWRRYH